MKRILVLLIVLLGSRLGMAQIPWESMKQEQRWRKGSQGQYRLVLADSSMIGKPWSLLEEAAHLLVSREVAMTTLGQKDLARLPESFPELGKPRWFALGPDGNVLISGEGEPDIPGVMAAFRSTGWRPRWEVRADFLREHPDHGEARSEELADLASMALFRARNLERLRGIQGDPFARLTPEEWDKAGAGPVKEALESLLKVPGWQYAESYFFFGSLPTFRNCTQMRPVLDRLLERLKAMAREDPSDYRVWETLGQMKPLLPAGFVETVTDGLEALPGMPRFDDSATGLACDLLIRDLDWQGLERYTAARWQDALDSYLRRPGSLGHGAEPSYWSLTFLVAPPRIHALLMLGREAEAKAFLLECRGLTGRRWPDVARNLTDRARIKKLSDPAKVRALEEVLKSEPVASVPDRAKNEPFRFVLGRDGGPGPGRPELQEDPRFDLWVPVELQWGTITDELRVLFPDSTVEGRSPSWALLKGTTVLEVGYAPPTAAVLGDAVNRHGEPILATIRRFLERAPDRRDAQWLYFYLLSSRLPNARLEADLLRRAQGWAFDSRGSTQLEHPADPEAWAAAAIRILPQVEAQLENWPESWRLWSHWLFWSRFHPKPAQPSMLLSRLPFMPSARQEDSFLNSNVLSQVTHTLRQRKAWKELANWCETVWTKDSRRRTEALVTRPSDVEVRYADPLGEFREIRGLVLKPWEEALVQLGDMARLKALQTDLKAMGYKDPGPPPEPRN